MLRDGLQHRFHHLIGVNTLCFRFESSVKPMPQGR
jgi:hypothetical protein